MPTEGQPANTSGQNLNKVYNPPVRTEVVARKKNKENVYEGGAGEPVFRVQYEIKYTREDGSNFSRTALGESTDVILRKSDLEALQALKAGDVVPNDSRFPEIFWGVTITDKYKIREDHAPGIRLLYLIKTSAGGNIQPNYPKS